MTRDSSVMTRHRTLSWIAWSVLLQARGEEAGLGCGHPPVPAGGRYVNVTGGLGEDSWAVRYSCDTGETSSIVELQTIHRFSQSITMNLWLKAHTSALVVAALQCV